MELKIGTRVDHKGVFGFSYGKGTITDCYEHDYEGRAHEESEWRINVKFDNGFEKTFCRDIVDKPEGVLPRIDIIEA